MTTKILVFYAGLLYGEYGSVKEFWKLNLHVNAPEIYNGAYMCIPYTGGYGWYRADGTPALDADVPKELRTLLLLMS